MKIMPINALDKNILLTFSKKVQFHQEKPAFILLMNFLI